jgi:single-strand DNA-binding protein
MLPIIRGVCTVGKDIELKYLQNGTAIAKVSLAFGDKEKKGDEWVDVTLWLEGVCFGRSAENISQYVQKGHRIEIEAVLSPNNYTNKEGQKVYSYQLKIDRFNLIEKSDRPKAEPKPKQQQKQPTRAVKEDISDDEIPF